MSIENKLTYLDGTKDAIKQAIIDKGVSVTEADTFRSYATKIGEIQGGGSGGDCPQGVIDLSGGVSNNFTLENEFKGIILPSNMDNVTSMYGCFSNWNKIKSITLPDLPNVINMSNCFADCKSLTSITLPSSLPNVTNMSNCFIYCYSLTSITLPSSLPNVTNMNYCFYYCSSLISLTLPDLPNVSYMEYCFAYCSSLQNLVIGNINPKIATLTNWDISNCTKLTVDSLVNIMNALPTITRTKTCTIGTTNISKLSAEQLAIGSSKGWTIN